MGAHSSQIYSEIWADPDYTKLSLEAQWLYEALLSQSMRDWAGIVPYMPTVWAGLNSNSDLMRMVSALQQLDEAYFTVTDERTGEVFIRAFMRRNASLVLGSANTFKSAMTSVRSVRSRKIRVALLAELRRLDQGKISRLPSSTTPGGKGGRPEDIYRATMALLEDEQTGHSGRSSGSSSGSPLEPSVGLGVDLGVDLEPSPTRSPRRSPTRSPEEDPSDGPQDDQHNDHPQDTSAGQDAEAIHNPQASAGPGVDLGVGLREDLGVGLGVGQGVGPATATSTYVSPGSLGRGVFDLETTPARTNAGARALAREEDPSQDPSPAPVSPPPKDQTSHDPEPDAEPFSPTKIVETWATECRANGDHEIRQGFVVALARKAEDLAREGVGRAPTQSA